MTGIVLIFIIIHSNLFGQDSAYLRRNAIKIDRPDSLDRTLYDSISRYRLIMVGESHGTKEPATFVGSLTDLLLRNGDTVQVGMEIPADQMQDFYFFHRTPRNNRASEAWSRLIGRLRDLPKVNLFYYDVNADDFKNYAGQFHTINIDGRVYSEFTERDSLMYIKIKQRIQLHPTWKTITLSGGVHNMLLPYHGITKMGLYLQRDTDLHLCGSLLSIMHSYAFGTMLNDSGQIANVVRDNPSSSDKIEYEHYLVIYPPGIDHNYNGIYFTRMVTASPLVTRQ